ncbi:STAS domain-containing protein [Candidatus Peregrinibacteria bacterium]|jgi:anti-anti-sigma factor|nr:STAS domain-containing protein [Candidatus Peregrinibacteria bacterium]
MSPLQILSEQINEYSFVVTIIGQMDESNADAKAPEIYSIIEKIPSEGNLILNFASLEYMNSKSIGYTTDFYNKMTEKNGKLVIAEAQEQILDILNVVGLSNVVSMVTSIKEAKEILGISEENESIKSAPLETEEKEEEPLSENNNVNPGTKTPETAPPASFGNTIQLKTEIEKNINTENQTTENNTINSQEKEAPPKIEINIPTLKPTDQNAKQEETEKNVNTEQQQVSVETQPQAPNEQNSNFSSNTETPQKPQEQTPPSGPNLNTVDSPSTTTTASQNSATVSNDEDSGIPILAIAIIISVILVLIVLFVK